LLIFLTGCGSLKEGFSNQKKNSSDEFLVEKKLPLVMPPNFNELPTPRVDKTIKNEQENQVKKLFTNQKNKELNLNTLKTINKTFEETLLEKIKTN
jgi:hypothetical protein